MPALAKSLILCTHETAPNIAIILHDRKAFNRSLDCISGDFAADLTPCAPDGAYGLSAPTGDGALVAIVNRWQDYSDHNGGVTSHFITADKMYFAGGFTYPEKGYNEAWSFTADRLSGNAVLKESGKGDVPYMCRSAKQKF